MDWIIFPQLEETQNLRHAFTLRQPRARDSEAVLSQNLEALGFPATASVEAEQIHGEGVAVVSESQRGKRISGVDALITRSRGTTLLIRTADCGPIFLFDAQKHAIGLVHSGKKGTQLNILGRTIEAMAQAFGTRANDLIVVLGPCIRPPHYEVDFARDIALQAQACGVGQFYDCGLNTAADLERFYSYRVEKGQTGRHHSALCLL